MFCWLTHSLYCSGVVWGRYTWLIVPEVLFENRSFQTAFLCQIVVKSLRKFFWQRQCFFALPFGEHIQVAHGWTGVEFAWLLTQDGAGTLGNAFQVKEKDSGTASSFNVCLASDMRRVGHVLWKVRSCRTLMIWRRCWPHGFSVFSIRKCHDNLTSRVSLSATCAVSLWFVGVGECG